MNTLAVSQPSAASKAAWICLAIAWVCFVVPIPGIGLVVGWPLNLVAFILAIVAMAKRGAMAGLFQLLASLIVSPVVYFIGLAVLFGSASAIGSSAQSTPSTPQQVSAPGYTVNVVSVECRDNYGRNRADITVTNTGSTTIPFAKVFVQFKDRSGNVLSAQDGYLSPHDVPPGATASATVYSSRGGAETCGVTSLQDRDGNAVQLQ